MIKPKHIASVVLLIFVLTANACSLGGLRVEMLKKDNDDKKADTRLEQVLDAIKSKDNETLKSMFSKQALDEAEDFDDSIDYLFEFFQGEDICWESNGMSVDETNDYGHKTKKLDSMYYVNTDKQKYIFYLIECTIDTDNPDNIGLYTLRVIKAEDRDTQFCKYQDMKAGIYKPEE